MTQLRRRQARHHPPDAAVPTSAPAHGGITDCALYEPTGRRAGRLPVEGAAEVARECDGFVWIGLHEPTPEQFAAVAAEFSLPSLAVDDAVVAHQRPKLELYGDLVFAVLKPVRYVDSEEVVDVGEIAFFVGSEFIVTVRHGESDVLRAVRADLDTAGPEMLAHGPTAVLYRAADRIVDGYESVAAAISVDVEEIEAQVFGGEETDHSQRIYRLKREVLEFRRAVAPLASPLERLAAGEVRGIDASAAHYFRDVHDHVLRAIDAVESHDRMLTDVLSADLAQVSVRQNRTAVRQNEDMRKISAWAAIALVPTAIAGIYGMNFENMPELKWEYGYFIVLGVIFTVCVSLHRLFRHNGWL
jgi:magnesium transporter